MFGIFNKRTKPNPKVFDEPAQLGKRSNNEELVDDPLLSTNITVTKYYKYFLYQLKVINLYII